MSTPARCFLDVDNKQTFEDYVAQMHTLDCHNFAVDFSPSTAQAGLNMSVEGVRQLLTHRNQKSTSSSSLWINLWGWSSEHQTIIEEVAKHYEMSLRLAHTMCPGVQHNAAGSVPPSNSARSNTSVSVRSMVDVFKTLWHFTTVDVSRRYICLGWNAMFFLPHSMESASKSKPNADRIWSTVLFCADGTVVSVFEDPPNPQPGLLARTRQNQINVFRNLSKANVRPKSALMETPIRPVASGASPQQVTAEMAGLLFYYLFDDWMSLFVQVSGSKDSYRHRLELLRSEMFQRPDSKQINQLHQLGKQLSALRSVCQSYRSLIEHLIRHQTTRPNSVTAQVLVPGTQPTGTSSNSYELVHLPISTGSRFERLLTRIESCAMTELDDCIAEKDGLVQMNFNLSNLRQAQTVEKLTRTTVLLAKVTILFLPISLATSYFSMQLQDIEDVPLKTYWATFSIVIAVTVAFVVGIDWLNSKYYDKPGYTGLMRILFTHRFKKEKGET